MSKWKYHLIQQKHTEGLHLWNTDYQQYRFTILLISEYFYEKLLTDIGLSHILSCRIVEIGQISSYFMQEQKSVSRNTSAQGIFHVFQWKGMESFQFNIPRPFTHHTTTIPPSA